MLTSLTRVKCCPMSTSIGWAAPDRLTTRIKRSRNQWPNFSSVQALTSQSWGQVKCARETRRGVRVTSTYSRCWQCPMLTCSTVWVSRRSSPNVHIVSILWLMSTHNSVENMKSFTTPSCWNNSLIVDNLTSVTQHLKSALRITTRATSVDIMMCI